MIFCIFYSCYYFIKIKSINKLLNVQKEINELLNKMCEKEVTPLKSPRSFSVKDVIANNKSKIVPDFFDILTKQNANTKDEKE